MNPRGIRTSDYVTLAIITLIVAAHSVSAHSSLAPTSLTLLYYAVFGLALLTRVAGWLAQELDLESPLVNDLATMSGPLVMISYILFVIWVVFDW